MHQPIAEQHGPRGIGERAGRRQRSVDEYPTGRILPRLYIDF